MASKAVALDPNSVVGLQALSAVEYHLGNFDEFERILRQALALNPNDPNTLAQLAWRLGLPRPLGSVSAYGERAIARTVDPPGWYYDPMTVHLYLEGRYREMLASAEHSAAGDLQGVAFLAIAYGALGYDRRGAGGAGRRRPGRRRSSPATRPPPGAGSGRSTASSTPSWTACARPDGPRPRPPLRQTDPPAPAAISACGRAGLRHISSLHAGLGVQLSR